VKETEPDVVVLRAYDEDCRVPLFKRNKLLQRRLMRNAGQRLNSQARSPSLRFSDKRVRVVSPARGRDCGRPHIIARCLGEPIETEAPASTREPEPVAV